MAKRRTTTAILTVLMVVGALFAAAAPASAGINEGDPPDCLGFKATIWGDDGHNRLVGTPGKDVIHGMGGRDRIWGLGGGDIICGGEGSDVIKGQRGRDKIDAGDGRDRIVGGVGDDLIIGGRGDDLLIGGFGNDTIRSGPGNDQLIGSPGIDTCDFDKQDGHIACELGDAIGQGGFGDAEFMVDVPRSFAVEEVMIGGSTVPVYVLDTLIGRANGQVGQISVEVLDANGNVLFSATPVAAVYGEQTLVVGQPKTVRITGTNGGYGQANFRTKANIAFLAEGTTYPGSRVFRLRDPIPANTMGTFTIRPVPGVAQVAAIVRSVIPQAAIEVDLTTPVVTTESSFTGPATTGATIVEVRAVATTWSIDFG